MEETTEVKSSSTMEEAMSAMGDSQPKFRIGQKIVATISAATDDGLALYINNTKKEIMLPKEEMTCESYNKADYASKVGEDIEVMIVELNPVKLSEKAIVAQKEEEEAIAKIADGEIFTVTCTGSNKGGLTAKLGSYDVFIPSSQIRIGFVKDLDKFVGKTLRLKAEKVENQARRLWIRTLLLNRIPSAPILWLESWIWIRLPQESLLEVLGHLWSGRLRTWREASGIRSTYLDPLR